MFYYTRKKGVSILETVMYLAMLTVLTLVVMRSLMSLFTSYSVIKTQQDVEMSAVQILDKLTRDIRDASSVVLASSTFDVPQGSVGLSIITDTTTDQYAYYVASSTLKVSKNGVYFGDLSQPNVVVNSFVVRYINGTLMQGIKIELNLQATPRYNVSPINENFYTTVQLRN